jgi:succinate-semialdehyde dehydrogenase / glutarate-semialdehyde dehydrogenase
VARLLNNGQSCIGAKRFIVAEAIADEFIQSMVDQFAALKVGDPLQLDTDVGPLATPAILQELDRQVQVAIAAGAQVLIGGKAIEGEGNFYAPTILTGLPPDSAIAKEEFFGPVALVFRVADVAAAIALANSTTFGLGASAWTQDAAEQQQLIEQIEAGAVFINGMVKSDPRLPFGGIKRSGFGRELGKIGMHEFVNIKTVWVK